MQGLVTGDDLISIETVNVANYWEFSTFTVSIEIGENCIDSVLISY